jgi:hypothetical protein
MTSGYISCQSIENAVLGSESPAAFLAPLLPAVLRSRSTVQASRRHRLRDATWLNLKPLGGRTPAGKHVLDG